MLQSGALIQTRYQILRQIGGGGMGAVYLAEDNRLPGRRCAVKEMSLQLISPQDRNWAINAFQQEAHMLANLRHPGLTPVTDFFPEAGNWYLVMDYIEGETLEAYLANHGGRLPVDEALRITRQLCEVLIYLHAQTPPVIFRDLKPGNVMLTSQGEVKLIDFGIARFFKPGQTHDTVNLGTPGYAAPEQYGRLGLQSGPRADVYSLGALLLQMVTGHDPTLTPFPLPDPRSVAHNIPLQIAKVITQATQAQPDFRYATVREMQQALFPPTYVLPPQPGTPPVEPTAGPSSNRRKWLWFAGGGIVVLLIISLLIQGLNGQPKSTPEPTVFSITVTAPVEPSSQTVTKTPTKTPVPVRTSTPAHISTPTRTPTSTRTPTKESSSLDAVFVSGGAFTKGSSRSDVEVVVNQLCTAYTDTWCRTSSFEDEFLRSQIADPDSNIYYALSREGNTGQYYIDRYEVTNQAYSRCVQAGVCSSPTRTGTNPRHSYFENSRYADYPVVYVSWYDANAYCGWVGGRLPTADEWEKAARGTDGDWWPWGTTSANVPTSQANYRLPGQAAAEEEDTTTQGGNVKPVGSYSGDHSPYGVMDMAGNVMEWVSSAYGPDRKEIRGGSWNTGSFALRAAGRTGREPTQVYFDVGFRCAYDRQP
ncbi:MAG: SUMF1/EgtB/PvdO family nonheme iron enzyme [Anaerolineae bacterium]|nr:SUMF1/EgtB/PvdO family nonheme iron enzyme [Anaerolineae bacterium]